MRMKHVGINFCLREKCKLAAGKLMPVFDFVRKINEVNNRLPITTRVFFPNQADEELRKERRIENGIPRTIYV